MISLIGKQATEVAFRTDVPGSGIIHLAVHAELRPGNDNIYAWMRFYQKDLHEEDQKQDFPPETPALSQNEPHLFR